MAILIFIISFVLGFFGGWLLRGHNVKIKQTQITLTNDIKPISDPEKSINKAIQMQNAFYE